VTDHSPEARERYFKRYTTVVSVSGRIAVSDLPYISHECPADSLRFAAIHFPIASCASFMRLYGPRWTGDGSLALAFRSRTPRPQFQMCA